MVVLAAIVISVTITIIFILCAARLADEMEPVIVILGIELIDMIIDDQTEYYIHAVTYSINGNVDQTFITSYLKEPDEDMVIITLKQNNGIH